MNYFEQRLYRIRPALLAAWLKRVLGVRRRPTTSREGLTFMVDPVSHFGRSLLDSGTYEPDMVDILLAILRPGDSFFDAGMNEGYFACIAARHVAPNGRVLGAEPQGRCIGVIEKNLMLNDIRNAKVCEIALAAVPGTAVIYLTPDTNSGATSIFRTTRIGLRAESVRTLPLDSLLERERMKHIRFMKVDCEGAEEQILQGATKTLKAHQIEFLMVEHHPQTAGKGAAAAIDAQLREAGYLLSQVANGGWIYHLRGGEAELKALAPITPVAPL